MKGDRYRCPNCGNVILEGDCVYTAVVCSRTLKCRKRHGGTDMVRDVPPSTLT